MSKNPARCINLVFSKKGSNFVSVSMVEFKWILLYIVSSLDLESMTKQTNLEVRLLDEPSLWMGHRGKKEKQQWKQLQVRVRMAFRASLVQWGSCMMSSKDRVWTKSSRSRGFTNVFSQKLGLSDLKKQAADAEKKGPPTQPVCPGTTISRKKMCLRSLDGKWIKCLGARYPIS